MVCRANARKAYIALRRVNFASSSTGFQFFHNEAKRDADERLKPLLQLQDNFANPVVETSRWKNGSLLGAAYTQFGPGITPSTTMYPAKQFTLLPTSPSPTFPPATISGNNLSTDLRYSTIPETTLKFDQGNLVELLPRNAPVTSYLWGYSNTLPIVTASGVTYATLSSAYGSAGGNLAALRSQPALARALVSTYAYRPLVGLTSQTDPTGRTITYEYDALGRLLRVRDEKSRILSQQQYHYAQP